VKISVVAGLRTTRLGGTTLIFVRRSASSSERRAHDRAATRSGVRAAARSTG